jgi:hypothetical protein
MLAGKVDDVHSKAVCAALEPIMHHGPKRVAKLDAFPIEIGLFGEERVQIVLLRRLVPCPGGAAVISVLRSSMQLTFQKQIASCWAAVVPH